MVFSSPTFLFYFLPIVLVGNFLIDKKYKNYFLLFMSLIFFAWGQINYLYIIILNIVINYTFSLLIKYNERYNKIYFIIAIALNLIILIYFKYMDFLIDILNAGFGTKIDALHIILPIGISFFTFQGMSYTIDVYRGDTDVEKNILNLALYIMLFPQLIAGPIVRYVDIKDDLLKREISFDDYVYGIKRFIIGLSKKVLIANVLGEVVDSIFENIGTTHTRFTLFICMLCYMYQIYYDFSGYSDMAIGMGRMLGFRYKENFFYPYESKSITEFWRRWHISLSRFFRDYVYIPLGGKYKHRYLNLLIVFFLTGLWHGASINFIIWGLWNAVFLILEKVLFWKYKYRIKIENDILKKIASILKTIYTYFVIYIGWIWFRCYDFDSAKTFFSKLFGPIEYRNVIYKTTWYMDNFKICILVVAVVFSFSYYKIIIKKIKSFVNEDNFEIISNLVYILLLFLSILFVYQNSYNPFIYFQF